jgi:CheY-like chemotaxis protein
MQFENLADERPTCGRVLIADDSDDVRDLLSAVLRMDGFEVIEARSGRDVLRRVGLLGTAAPVDLDLVISDVRMPEFSGLELLSLFRSAGNHTPFILVTAYAGPEVFETAQKFQAHVVDKPFSHFELRDMARSFVDPDWW